MTSKLPSTPVSDLSKQPVKNETPSPSPPSEKITDPFNMAPIKKYTIPKRTIPISSPNQKVAKTSQSSERKRVRNEHVFMKTTIKKTKKLTIKNSKVVDPGLQKLASLKRHRDDNTFVPKKAINGSFDTLTSRATEISHVLGLANLSVTSGFELAAEYIYKKLVSLDFFADDETCSYKKLVAGAVFFAVRIFNTGPNKLCLNTFADNAGIEVNEMEKIVRQVVSVRGKLVKTEWVEQGIFDFINVAEFV